MFSKTNVPQLPNALSRMIFGPIPSENNKFLVSCNILFFMKKAEFLSNFFEKLKKVANFMKLSIFGKKVIILRHFVISVLSR